MRNLVSAHLRAGGLALVDGLVEVYPSRKVLRLPWGKNMVQLDPKTFKPLKRTHAEQVRALLDLVSSVRSSPVLKLAPLALEEVALHAAKEALRTNIEGRSLEQFKGVEIAKLLETEGSNITKLFLIRAAWLSGIADEDGLVDAVIAAFEEHGSHVPSRFTEDPREFEVDVRYAARNWLNKAGRVPEGVATLSRADAEWILAVAEELQERTGAERRNATVERYLGELFVWARAHGEVVRGGIEFDLPSKIEGKWKIVSPNKLRAFRAQFFEGAKEREDRLAAFERRRGSRRAPPNSKGSPQGASNSGVAVLREVRRPFHKGKKKGGDRGSVRRVCLRYVPSGELVYPSMAEAILDLRTRAQLRGQYTRAAVRWLGSASRRFDRTNTAKGDVGTLSMGIRSDTESATLTFIGRTRSSIGIGPVEIITLDHARSLPAPPKAPKARWIELYPQFNAPGRPTRRQMIEIVGSMKGRLKVPPQQLQPSVPVARRLVRAIVAAPVEDRLKEALLDLAMLIKANKTAPDLEGIVREKTGLDSGPFVELRRDVLARLRGLTRNTVAPFIRICWNLSLGDGRPLLEPALNYSGAVHEGRRRVSRGRLYRFDPALLEDETESGSVKEVWRMFDVELVAAKRAKRAKVIGIGQRSRFRGR